MQREDIGTVRTNLGTFDRVVIDEYESIQPQIQLLSQETEILGLGSPVDPPRDQMLSLQRHIGPQLQDFEHVLFFVLATEADQKSPRHLLDDKTLESQAE